MFANFDNKIEIRERCKGVHCVDLGESFHMSIYLQNLASIQSRTSPVKFARSPCTDPPGSRYGKIRVFPFPMGSGSITGLKICRLL